MLILLICMFFLNQVLINEDLFNPRAIVVAPSLGYMFWSDWYEKKPKLERARLDGTDRRQLVTERLGWPNGIAVDSEERRLYWANAYYHKIETIRIDGTDRRELIGGDSLPHIFGLSLLGDYLYWTDWHQRSVSRINKHTGNDKIVILEHLPDVMGLKTFKVSEKLPTNPCAENNGGCSHLCFNRPDDYICRCPLGLELEKDKKLCVAPSAFLLYARKDKIGRLSIENSDSENDAMLPIKDIKEISSLGIHVASSQIYWADSKLHCIGRSALNGSNPEKVHNWINKVEGKS
jgi:low density lipoprotein receptor-related protein 5/6